MNTYPYLRFPGFRLKALTLSYDDGVVFDRHLMEILDRYGLKCTFNINSGLFTKGTGHRRLTEEEAVALYKDSGHEVAVHGVKHLSLAVIPREMAVRDVIEDRINLERLFGRVVKGMAYANGVYDDDTVEILRLCGIEFARTTVSTEKFDVPTDWLRLPATCHHKNPRLMELAQTFVNAEAKNSTWRDVPKLFYLWGHSYEFDDDNNWEIIENFASFVGNRDDIWYATNGEIERYVTAFRGLIFSADEKVVTNPSADPVWLLSDGEMACVRGGETLRIG